MAARKSTAKKTTSAKKETKTARNARLKAMVAAAKKIKKANPGYSWATCMRQAAKKV